MKERFCVLCSKDFDLRRKIKIFTAKVAKDSAKDAKTNGYTAVQELSAVTKITTNSKRILLAAVVVLSTCCRLPARA